MTLRIVLDEDRRTDPQLTGFVTDVSREAAEVIVCIGIMPPMLRRLVAGSSNQIPWRYKSVTTTRPSGRASIPSGEPNTTVFERLRIVQ